MLSFVVLPTVAIAVDLPYAFQAGDPVIAQQLNDNFDALKNAMDALAIREDTTLQIDPLDTCAAIQQALDDLDARQIVGAATVTIELFPGTYACESTIVVRHPAGDHIRIRGTGNSPADVTLTFPADTTGIRVQLARALRGLENLTLQGAIGSGWGAGVLLEGSSAVWAADLVVRGFSSGVYVSAASSLSGSNIVMLDNGAWGAVAVASSQVTFSGSEASNNGYAGFGSTGGSRVGLFGCTASDNASLGYVANQGGTLEIYDSVAEGNGGGYAAWLGSAVELVDSTAIDNAWHGISASSHASIVATNSVANDNGEYGYSAFSGGYLWLNGTYQATGNDVNDMNLALNTHDATGAVIIH